MIDTEQQKFIASVDDRLLPWSKTSIRMLSNQLGESADIYRLRSEAFKRRQTTALPSPTEEAWRRTNPRLFSEKNSKLWNPKNAVESVYALPEPSFTDNRIYQSNCKTDVIEYESNTLNNARIYGLDRKINNADRGVCESMIKDVPIDHDSAALTLTHLAYYQGGFFIHAPQNSQLDEPIYVRHLIDTPGAALYPLNLIHAGENSRVTVVIDQHSDSDEASLLNNQIRLQVASGAILEVILLNRTGITTRVFDSVWADVARDGQLLFTWADLTRGHAVSRKAVKLSDPGADATFRGVHVGSENSHLDMRTLQEHAAHHSQSDLLFKSVLFDKSRSIYQGLIDVSEQADKTNAYQMNRNLLMSPGSHTNSIPTLQIRVDDVKCSHGSSSGKVDKKNLFYLMSRGLREKDAIKLMVSGFIADIGREISNPVVREYWRDEVLGFTDRIM